jgi:hypothetical protein
MERYHYTYLLINPETNEFYIGSRSTKNGVKPEDDTKYMGSMKTWVVLDKSILIKKIIRIFNTNIEAISHEIELIKHFIKDPLNRNYHIPTIGYSTYGVKYDDDRRKKISEQLRGRRCSEESKNKMRGENNPRWSGGPFTKCHCGKKIFKRNKTCFEHRVIMNGMKGKTNYDVWLEKYGEEIAKEKWSEAQKKSAKNRKGNPNTMGKNNGMYGRSGELNPFYGKTHTNELKEKNSELAKQRTGFNGQRTKPILDVENGVFYTKKELAELFNISTSYINRVIMNGKSKNKFGMDLIVLLKNKF